MGRICKLILLRTLFDQVVASCSLLTGDCGLLMHLSLDFRGTMVLCLSHAQTLRNGQLARMRRSGNRYLISAVWALVLWLIVLEKRMSRKGLDSRKVSIIVYSGMVVLFGQTALDAGKSCVRQIFNKIISRIVRNNMTKPPSGERSRLGRSGCNVVRSFAARNVNGNRRSGGNISFDGID